MEILVKGRDYEVWGDPRAAEWAPPEMPFDPAYHGTMLAALVDQVRRRSGYAAGPCHEEARRCRLLLHEHPPAKGRVGVTLVVTGSQDIPNDPVDGIAMALCRNAKLWPKTDRFNWGLDMYWSIARAVADHLASSGCICTRRPPMRPHSSSDFGLREPGKS